MRLVLVFLVSIATAFATALTPQVSEREQLDTVFDHLVFAKYLSLPFVKVHDLADPTPERDKYGFLLSPPGAKPIELFDLEYDEDTIPGDERDKSPYVATILNFEAWGKQHLEELRTYNAVKHEYDESAPDLSDESALYLISKAAAARGLKQLSNDYYAVATEANRDSYSAEEGSTFEHRMTELLAGNLFNSAAEKIANYRNPRRAALPYLQNLADFFKGSRNYKDAMAFRSKVLDLVHEDAEHKSTTITGAATDAEVSELLFQLRDQQGAQISSPGLLDALRDPRGDRSPAARLLALGLPVLPKVIEAITDPRLSRTRIYSRATGANADFITVGEVAEQIFERMSHTDFNGRHTGNASISPAAYKEKAQAWWVQMQARGLDSVLADQVTAGGFSSIDALYALMERNPKAALEAVRASVTSNKDQTSLAMAIVVLARHDSPDVDSFVRSTFASGAKGVVGVALAEVESHYDRDLALQWVVSIWNSNDEAEFFNDTPVDYIMSCGQPEAIAVLRQRLHTLSPSKRAEALQSAASEPDWHGQAISRPSDPATKKRFEEAVERLLVEELADDELVQDMPRDESARIDETISDIAYATLMTKFPAKYPPLPKSLFGRKMGKAEAANRWRKSKGMPALPLPTRPEIAQIDPSALRTAIGHFEQARTKDEIAKAGDRLLGFGLPAAEPLARYVSSGNASAGLKRISSQLCSIVREVRIDPSAGATEALTGFLRSLQGQPLRSAAIVEVIPLLIASHHKGMVTTLRWERDEDGRGVSVHLSADKDPSPDSRSDDAAAEYYLVASNKLTHESYSADDNTSFIAKLDGGLTGPGLALLMLKVVVA